LAEKDVFAAEDLAVDAGDDCTCEKGLVLKKKGGGKEMRRTALCFVDDVCGGVEPVAAHGEGLELSGGGGKGCCGFASYHCLQK
jgi:hypothetical protein